MSSNKSLVISFVSIPKLDKTSRQIARSTIFAFELNRRDEMRKAKAREQAKRANEKRSKLADAAEKRAHDGNIANQKKTIGKNSVKNNAGTTDKKNANAGKIKSGRKLTKAVSNIRRVLAGSHDEKADDKKYILKTEREQLEHEQMEAMFAATEEVDSRELAEEEKLTSEQGEFKSDIDHLDMVISQCARESDYAAFMDKYLTNDKSEGGDDEKEI